MIIFLLVLILVALLFPGFLRGLFWTLALILFLGFIWIQHMPDPAVGAAPASAHAMMQTITVPQRQPIANYSNGK